MLKQKGRSSEEILLEVGMSNWFKQHPEVIKALKDGLDSIKGLREAHAAMKRLRDHIAVTLTKARVRIAVKNKRIKLLECKVKDLEHELTRKSSRLRECGKDKLRAQEVCHYVMNSKNALGQSDACVHLVHIAGRALRS